MRYKKHANQFRGGEIIIPFRAGALSRAPSQQHKFLHTDQRNVAQRQLCWRVHENAMQRSRWEMLGVHFLSSFQGSWA